MKCSSNIIQFLLQISSWNTFFFNLKIRSNLTKDERKTLKELQKLRVHEFRFPVDNNNMPRAKIEEQLGKSRKAKIDPTSRLMSKIQKKTLRTQKKNLHSTQFPHLNMVQSKRINRKRNFSMQVIVCPIGMVPYGISKYLADIIQLKPNKNQLKVQSRDHFFASTNVEN